MRNSIVGHRRLPGDGCPCAQYTTSARVYVWRCDIQRKLTITIDEEVYQGLQQQIGRGNISQFIEGLVRPHILTRQDLEEGYKAMAVDEEHEAEAHEWAEGLIGDALA